MKKKCIFVSLDKIKKKCLKFLIFYFHPNKSFSFKTYVYIINAFTCVFVKIKMEVICKAKWPKCQNLLKKAELKKIILNFSCLGTYAVVGSLWDR